MAGVVTVACKLPNGVMLQAYKMIDTTEPSPTGARMIKKAVPAGEPVEVKGVAHPFGRAPDGLLTNGYALTHGVDSDVWEAWFRDNKDTDLVRNKLIFAFAKEADVMAETKAMREVRSGLEPIDPTRLTAEFNGNRQLSSLQQAPESAKPQV